LPEYPTPKREHLTVDRFVVHDNNQALATASTHPAQRRRESPWKDLAGRKVANHPLIMVTEPS
jgi:hypothetical protein